jgi:hypothetical protein
MNIIRDRREVLAASAAVTVNAAVTQLGLTRSAAAQGQSPGLPTIQPGTNTSFAPLKQVEAGVLMSAMPKPVQLMALLSFCCTAGLTTSTVLLMSRLHWPRQVIA